MENPCNECIVQSMCKVGCDLLVNYIRIRIKDYSDDGINAKYVSAQLRIGRYKIIGDRIWRMRGHGKPMYDVFG